MECQKLDSKVERLIQPELIVRGIPAEGLNDIFCKELLIIVSLQLEIYIANHNLKN